MANHREIALRSIAVGDIFHGTCPNGASLICLVISVTEATIHARRVTTQEDIEFDRELGVERSGDGRVLATIDSVAPLPADIHEVMLGLDRRYRFGHGLERLKLTDVEKRAFSFIHDYYPSNRL